MESVVPTVIHKEPWDRDRRLAELGLDREKLIEVVKGMVAARGGCTVNDAKSAPGFMAWNAGIRGLRMQFKNGWARETIDGIETIKSEENKLRVSVMNTTSDTGLTYGSPRNRTPKGAAASRIVDLNGQLELIAGVGPGKPAVANDGCSIWYLCVYDESGEVRAELSRPTVFDCDHFVAFNERIFILGQGEWDDVDWAAPDGDEGEEFDVDVRRKS